MQLKQLLRSVHDTRVLSRRPPTSAGWRKKVGPQTHSHNSVKSEPILKNSTGWFVGKFVVKWVSKIPPHIACVATLPCETLMSAKQASNDKLQGSEATYLRCMLAGLLITKLGKVYCWVCQWIFFCKSVNIWRSYKQERDCLVHFLRLLAVCWPGVRFTKYLTIYHKIILSLSLDRLTIVTYNMLSFLLWIS